MNFLEATNEVLKMSQKKLKEVIKDSMGFVGVRTVSNYIDAVAWQINNKRWEHIPQVFFQIYNEEELQKFSKKEIMQLYVMLFKLKRKIK